MLTKDKLLVELYSKPDCGLCDEVKDTLAKLKQDFPLEILEIDITKDRQLFERFKEEIPVAFIDGRKWFKYRVEESDLRKKLQRFVHQV